LAEEKDMKVQFTYWCKHEISPIIQTTDNTSYTSLTNL